MSFTCAKEFTISVKAPPSALTPFAYYQCKANPDVDMVDSHPLTPLGAAPIIVPGLIGNAFEVGMSAPTDWFMQNAPGVGTTDWDLSASDFTVRFWHYLPSSALVASYTLFGTSNWGFLYGNDYLGLGYYWRIQDPFSNWHYVFQAGPFSVGWHYVVGTYAPSGTIKIHVDTLPTVPAASIAMKSSTGLFFRIAGNSPPLQWLFDEIAIWKGLISETEMTHDYNSGAGRTWPNVP